MEGTPERWAAGPTVLQSVWRHRWLVVLATVVLGVAGYAAAAFQEPTYETGTQLYLTDPGASDVFGRTGGIDFYRYVPQQEQRVTSAAVLSAAAEQLDDGATPGTLREQLAVTGDPDVGTLRIVVRDADPARAATVADVVAAAYEDDVRATQSTRLERAVAELDAAADDIQDEIDALTAGQADPDEPSATTAGQVGVLAQRLIEIDGLSQQLVVDARLFGSGVEFVEQAEVPSSPIAPAPRRTGVATALLGAVVASLLAYWLAGRVRRVSSADEPGAILGVPLLGVLPTYAVEDRASLRTRAQLDPRTTEAYRFVQSSLARVLGESGARSVMMTSAAPRTGKTETSLQVALSADDRGTRVLLVDGDVRMRGLTSLLQADDLPGLVDLARAHPPDPTSLVSRHAVTDGGHLEVVTAGRATGDEPPPINERWFGRALRRLAESYELVVVDSPPLLAVADTATIAAHVDAVVLVVREGSNVDDLERVHQRMRFVGPRLVGYVYLAPDALDDRAFDYGLVRSTGRERAVAVRRVERTTEAPAPAPHPAQTPRWRVVPGPAPEPDGPGELWPERGRAGGDVPARTWEGDRPPPPTEGREGDRPSRDVRR